MSKTRHTGNWLHPGVAGLTLLPVFIVAVGSPSWSVDPKPTPQPASKQVKPTPPDSWEARIRELGWELPEPATSLAIYKRVVVADRTVYVAGHIPVTADGKIITGKLGDDMDVAEAQAAARRCAFAVLASLRHELGSLDAIERLVKTTGMVNATSDFTEHPEVVNGFSEVFVELMGEDWGQGARAAVGMASLPRGAACEIEAVFLLKEKRDDAKMD